jgi:hypothetical protein
MPLKRADKMLIAEVRKLTAAMPAFMDSLGFTPIPDECFSGTWEIHSPRFDCNFTVHYITNEDIGHNPWLGCCFNRPLPHPELPWSHESNLSNYQDIHDALCANKFTGKYNCHLFRRNSADVILDIFRYHLTAALTA